MPWDQQRAVALMVAADGLVAPLGVSGFHPAVLHAAARVCEASDARDMNAFVARIAEFEALVRKLAV